MEFWNGENVPREAEPAALPHLPQVWIGYLFGVATIVAEIVAVELHPELAKGGFNIPPLYLFLSAFVGGVYWLVCVYQYHVMLAHIPGWKHPISPGRAVGFHFLPVYNFYWVFKWPQEIARFVNWRLQKPLMKPQSVGIAVFAAFIVRLLLDPGLGLILLFVAFSHVSACLRRALASPAVPAENLPPSTE
jgi:hypothetical protein